MKKKALIVLPTYNEAGNIEKLINEIFNQEKKLEKWTLEILVNDSFSEDKTGEIAKKLQKKYHNKLHLIESKKEGLGKAYYQAFKYAQEKIKPYVVFEMDADFSHNPKKIPEMLKEIEKGADFVIGSRYIKSGSIPKNWGWHRKVFSIFGNLIVKFGFMILSINDWTSGFRSIKMWVINQSLEFVKNYSGYVFQIALLDQAYKKGAKISEIPIDFVDRQYGRSKISFGQYIFQILWYIFNYSSFIKFIIVGFIGFFIDFGFSYFLIEKIHQSVWIATIISTESAIVCNFILNNFWSFSYKKIEGGLLKYLFQFFKFNIVSAGSVIIQTVGLSILVGVLGKKFWYLYKIFIIAFIIIPYSYLMYNKIVWKKK